MTLQLCQLYIHRKQPVLSHYLLNLSHYLLSHSINSTGWLLIKPCGGGGTDWTWKPGRHISWSHGAVSQFHDRSQQKSSNCSTKILEAFYHHVNFTHHEISNMVRCTKFHYESHQERWGIFFFLYKLQVEEGCVDMWKHSETIIRIITTIVLNGSHLCLN